MANAIITSPASRQCPWLHVIILHQLLPSCTLAVRQDKVRRVRFDDTTFAGSILLEDQSRRVTALAAKPSVVPFSRMSDLLSSFPVLVFRRNASQTPLFLK